MADIKPFRAVRPRADLVGRIAALGTPVHHQLINIVCFLLLRGKKSFPDHPVKHLPGFLIDWSGPERIWSGGSLHCRMMYTAEGKPMRKCRATTAVFCG